MPHESAVLQRIQALGLVEHEWVHDAEGFAAALPEAERPSVLSRLLAEGHLRESTVAAVRQELLLPAPWWGHHSAGHAWNTDTGAGAARSSQQPTRRQTIALTSAEAVSPAEPFMRYPLPHWPRFEPVAFLGEGGMGKVFKAFDPKLRRWVALKYLHYGTRAGALEAILVEARAQAQLDHPHVVRLLEAGEIEGLAYLVLAHVDGVSMKDLKVPLTLREKVALFEGVAEGLHAIHRQGIVHRDVKPANILVRRDEHGRFEALVTDFGVARDLRHEVDGPHGLVGTPLYMSPEQALGDREADRRSDVYSLGASLYHVLLGSPPFPSTEGQTLLAKVIHDAPVRPRTVAPGFPEDLEAILLKCLEKDPERRYSSALALASDLERFLSGQPVAARPASLSHRANLWVRRNRMLATGLAVSALLVAASGFVALKAWVDRRAAVVLAQRWSAEVSDIEAARRQIHMLPTRDVRPELDRLEARRRAFESEVDRAPRGARGAGQFALARAAMAFQNWEEAKRRLEASFRAGYRGPDADLAQGEVNAQIYLAALQEIERVPGPELRARRLKEMERDLREPALRDLRAALKGGAVSSLSGALLAMIEQAPDLALARAREAFDAEPWRYEAKLLEAGIRINQARALRLTGGYQQGLEVLERADPAVRTACDIGRSDPAAWLAQATRWEVAVIIARHLGIQRFEDLEKALQACRIAEACRPGHASALALRGRLVFLGADMRAERADPTEGFQQAADLLQAAILADSGNAITRGDLAELQVSRGLRRMQMGLDPLEAFKSAIAAGQAGLALHPSEPRLLNIVGLAWLHSATWTFDNGQDPGPCLDQAEASFKAIQAIDARVPFAQNNLGWMNLVRSRQALVAGGDPMPAAAAAERHLLGCIELNPSSAHSRQLLGEVAIIRGRHMLDRARDPGPELSRAREAVKQAQETNPMYPATFITRCRLEAARADAFARFGGSPAARDEALVEMEAAYRRLAVIAPGRLEADIEKARTLVLRAEFRKSAGLRAEARRCLDKVLARQAGNPEALSLLRRLG